MPPGGATRPVPDRVRALPARARLAHHLPWRGHSDLHDRRNGDHASPGPRRRGRSPSGTAERMRRGPARPGSAASARRRRRRRRRVARVTDRRDVLAGRPGRSRRHGRLRLRVDAGSGPASDEGMSDPFDLERFVAAQDAAGTYERALGEIRRGRKSSHWMWFVFPQVAGLGRSEMAAHYAIADLAEARAYLDHPVLGSRLRECAQLVLESTVGSAEEIFGSVDATKLRSSMTLFEAAAPDEPVFGE